MIQHEYELVTIFRPDLDDAAMKVDVERIEGVISENGGTLLILDDWGKRKLAYPVRKHMKGHYVLFNFLSTANLIIELERNLRIIEPVIRFLTSKIGDSVDADVRIEQAAEQRERMNEEAERIKAEAEARAQREIASREAAAALEAEAVARAEAAAAEAGAEYAALAAAGAVADDESADPAAPAAAEAPAAEAAAAEEAPAPEADAKDVNDETAPTEA